MPLYGGSPMVELRTVGRLVAALLLGGCDKAAEAPKSASDQSGVTLILGDQAKGLRTVVEAAHTLDGIDYKVQWANFQGIDGPRGVFAASVGRFALKSLCFARV